MVSITESDFSNWTEGLNTLYQKKRDPNLSYIKKVYKGLKQEELNAKDVKKLLKLINLKFPKNTLFKILGYKKGN